MAGLQARKLDVFQYHMMTADLDLCRSSPFFPLQSSLSSVGPSFWEEIKRT
jgi:hypothetical protein